MRLEEKQIQLKDGRTAILKSPEISDAQQQIDYLKAVSGETAFLSRYPEEWDVLTVAGEESWIRSRAESENAMMISCYMDGKVVGNCEFTRCASLKTAHRVNLSIAILREYWNLGIGSALFAELIAAAKRGGAEILELECIEGNDRARHLYEKFGFRVAAEKPNAYKLKDGTYLREIYMQKFV